MGSLHSSLPVLAFANSISVTRVFKVKCELLFKQVLAPEHILPDRYQIVMRCIGFENSGFRSLLKFQHPHVLRFQPTCLPRILGQRLDSLGRLLKQVNDSFVPPVNSTNFLNENFKCNDLRPKFGASGMDCFIVNSLCRRIASTSETDKHEREQTRGSLH
ncbi:hypothetical protein K239x_47540 [Planctomycetes bacterium K23_9]|uniref:Uncharacterized protein n=1 Tax=Stieleria marina TaxID=1930275 RepID=A0A517P052_9BACT|nr:hypothetical protein K239x_47540 [Planctomycetes bacterium K23_9]